VRYNARDVAVMRGHFEGVPVVLASATPALESLQMADAGRYRRLVLPSRFGESAAAADRGGQPHRNAARPRALAGDGHWSRR
jgi:primosomal protein N'